jgi:hypothetical protein
MRSQESEYRSQKISAFIENIELDALSDILTPDS